MSAGDLLYLLAALILGCAAGVALSKNIVHSAFMLLGTFMGVAGLYAHLTADFLAVIQVVVYVGGILVVILFAVMLTGQIENIGESNLSGNVARGAVLLIALVVLLAGLVAVRTRVAVAAPAVTQGTAVATGVAPGEMFPPVRAPAGTGDTKMIGNLLLSKYRLPFEMASMVLLAALIGAVTLIRKEDA